MTDATGVEREDWLVWRSFLSMHGQLSRELDRQLQRDSGISQADYSILIAIFDSPNRQLRARELAELLAWEKSRVSHQVARMESRGLVVRKDCADDARGTWVELTPNGRRTVLGAMRKHSAEIRRYFFDLLTVEERATIGAISRKVLEELNPAACELADAIDGSSETDTIEEPGAA